VRAPSSPAPISATALLAGSAGLSLATARRAPIAGTLEVAGPIGLACRGVFVGLAGLAPVWLDVLAGILLVAACAVWWGSGSVGPPGHRDPRRPRRSR
jgi:hypothetical protein